MPYEEIAEPWFTLPIEATYTKVCQHQRFITLPRESLSVYVCQSTSVYNNYACLHKCLEYQIEVAELQCQY